MPLAIILLVAVLGGGGGTIAVSQNSMPGDSLFGVKLVTENLRVATTIGEDNKNDLRAQLAEKRLQEIDNILKSKAISTKQIKGIDRAIDNMDTHLEKMEDKAKELRNKDQENEALKVNEDLAARTVVIAHVLESQKSSAKEAEIRGRLDDSISKNEDRQFRVENEIKQIQEQEKKEVEQRGADNMQAASGKIGAAENKITEVEQKLSLKESKLKPDAVAAAKQKLQEAKNILSSAKIDLSNNKFLDAFSKANQVFRTTSEAKALIEVGEKELRNVVEQASQIIDDMDRENRQQDRGVEIKAEIMGNSAAVKVETRFMSSATDKAAIVQEILNKIKLNQDAIQGVLKIENGTESLQDRIEAKADIKNGMTEVRAEIRFALNTTDRALIISGIGSKLSGLSAATLSSTLEVRIDQGANKIDNEDNSQGRNSEDNFLRATGSGAPTPSSGADIRKEDGQNDEQAETGDDRLLKINVSLPISSPDIKQEDRQQDRQLEIGDGRLNQGVSAPSATFAPLAGADDKGSAVQAGDDKGGSGEVSGNSGGTSGGDSGGSGSSGGSGGGH